MKRRAATLSLGTVNRRLSSVTVPIMTIVLLFDFSEVLATILEMETGGRLMRDIKSLRRTTLLKEESVRPSQSVISSVHCAKSFLKNARTYGPRSGRASQVA